MNTYLSGESGTNKEENNDETMTKLQVNDAREMCDVVGLRVSAPPTHARHEGRERRNVNKWRQQNECRSVGCEGASGWA
jgi:hypothetical protein